MFLVKAEGIDIAVNETFPLANRSSRYSGTVILPRWSTHFGAILKHHQEPVFIPPKSPQLLWEDDVNHVGPSITSHREKLTWLISFAPKKSRNTKRGRSAGSDAGILTAACRFRLPSSGSGESIP